MQTNEKSRADKKTYKKRPTKVLEPSHLEKVRDYCVRLSQYSNRRILFVDESGFNLHISTDYGYSLPGQTPTLYQPASKGQNISLCALISINGL